jgi:ribonuclease HI
MSATTVPAQEPDWRIVFDGGSEGNPGRGYGSYRLQPAGGEWMAPVRLEFGARVTNNEAEYGALIAALRDVAGRAPDPRRLRVEVLGDSMLVIRQMKGEWRVKAANLAAPFTEARRLASGFGAIRYKWHRRDVSVGLLGH